MSPRVDIIAGFPASGKSMLVKEIVQKDLRCSFTDWHGWNQSPQNDKYRDCILGLLRVGRGCIIESSRFTSKEYLENAMALVKDDASTIHLKLFENDPLQCMRNALSDRERAGKSDAGSIARILDIVRFSKNYNYRPRDYAGHPNVEIKAVWKGELGTTYIPGNDQAADHIFNEVERRLTADDGNLHRKAYFTAMEAPLYRAFEDDLRGLLM